MADQTLTPRVGALVPLSSTEAWANGHTHKFNIKFSDINDATLTTNGDVGVIKILDTPTDWAVTHAAIDVVTAFAGDSGALTLDFGTDGDPNNFCTAMSLKTAGPVLEAAGGVVATLTGSYAAASDVIQAEVITAAGTGGNALADWTAGEVNIYFTLVQLNQ
jgi:hypothetical protein